MGDHTESNDDDDPYDEETVAALRRLADSDFQVQEYAKILLEIAEEEGEIDNK